MDPQSQQEKITLLAGAVKNALERGQPPMKIKQSLLNAGYKPAEVNAAMQNITQPQTIPQQHLPPQAPHAPQAALVKPEQDKEIPKMPEPPTEQPQKATQAPQQLPQQPQSPQQAQPSQQATQPPQPLPKDKAKIPTNAGKKKFPRWLVVSLIIFSALVLIGAAIMGLYI
jgi:hypothetical protein